MVPIIVRCNDRPCTVQQEEVRVQCVGVLGTELVTRQATAELDME